MRVWATTMLKLNSQEDILHMVGTKRIILVLKLHYGHHSVYQLLVVSTARHGILVH